jgi:hypothetical protein
MSLSIDSITDFFKESKVTIIERSDDSYLVSIDDINICIYKTDSYQDIIRKLNKQKQNINNAISYEECIICRDLLLSNKCFNILTCPKCVNVCCVNCYIKLLSNGDGIVICPFCKSESGHYMTLEEQKEYSESLKKNSIMNSNK